jgi:hypothetical protein
MKGILADNDSEESTRQSARDHTCESAAHHARSSLWRDGSHSFARAVNCHRRLSRGGSTFCPMTKVAKTLNWSIPSDFMVADIGPPNSRNCRLRRLHDTGLPTIQAASNSFGEFRWADTGSRLTSGGIPLARVRRQTTAADVIDCLLARGDLAKVKRSVRAQSE